MDCVLDTLVSITDVGFLPPRALGGRGERPAAREPLCAARTWLADRLDAAPVRPMVRSTFGPCRRSSPGWSGAGSPRVRRMNTNLYRNSGHFEGGAQIRHLGLGYNGGSLVVPDDLGGHCGGFAVMESDSLPATIADEIHRARRLRDGVARGAAAAD